MKAKRAALLPGGSFPVRLPPVRTGWFQSRFCGPSRSVLQLPARGIRAEDSGFLRDNHVHLIGPADVEGEFLAEFPAVAEEAPEL